MAGELCVGFVGSPVAAGQLHERMIRAPRSRCRASSRCYTAADVPGHNLFGLVVADEPFLADGELLYFGQPVAVVAADESSSVGERPQGRAD